jgi:hypothetical protein
MSFHASADNVRLSDSTLYAVLSNADGEPVEASIDLNSIIGNDDGPSPLLILSCIFVANSSQEHSHGVEQVKSTYPSIERDEWWCRLLKADRGPNRFHCLRRKHILQL